MGKKIKHTVYLIAMLLTLSISNSFAQISPVNTGDDPYIGTTHSYQVTIDEVANTDSCWITNNTTTYNFADHTSIISSSTSGSTYTIEIKFDSISFPVAETWVLWYSESDINGDCVAERSYTIYLKQNTFYETVYSSGTPASSFTECHDSTATVQDWSVISGTEFPTVVNFDVLMYKDLDFKLNKWQFDAEIVAGGGYSLLSIDKGAASSSMGANFTVTPKNATTYTVSVDSATGSYASDTVNIAVEVEGLMQDDGDITLDIKESGFALSGTNNIVTTIDNFTVSPSGETNNTDRLKWRKKTVTNLGVPATQNITYGTGENATTASYPMQNSTHKYVVQMEDVTNFSNPSSRWHVENASGGGPITSGITTYTIDAHSQSVSRDSVSIRFYFAAGGEYIIYFTEEGDNGCSSIRSYPITMAEPFDVDVIAAASDCPYISGRVNTEATLTETTIGDTVKIMNPSYPYNWSFDFSIESSPNFDISDLDISAITVSTGTLSNLSIVAGAATKTGTVNVSNSAASPNTEVILNITYNGLYIADHSITVTIDNIEGSFNESDADGTNSASHTIYRVPQPGTLAGVD
ncbi:MAG: hypothetical protein PF541_01485 [Prolixibacteraceae bacterium]|jgi:hypothetical protein|nr:hypothetical protein [Prolixibacteraceae bacterium]